jgi:hypothetical protein
MRHSQAKLKQEQLLLWLADHRNGIIHSIAGGAVFFRLLAYIGAKWGNVFDGAGAIGGIVVWTAEAYLGSYIFYLIVVRIREKADAIHTRSYVSTKVRELLDVHWEMVQFLEDRANDQAWGQAEPNTIDAWIQSLDSAGREGVRTFFNDSIQKIVGWHNLLYKMSNHIDTELVPILTEIEDGRFCKGDVLNADAFSKYDVQIGHLRQYYEKRFGVKFIPIGIAAAD